MQAQQADCCTSTTATPPTARPRATTPALPPPGASERMGTIPFEELELHELDRSSCDTAIVVKDLATEPAARVGDPVPGLSRIALKLRLSWMSCRIVVASCQVLAQLGNVLQLDVPEDVEQVLQVVKLLAFDVAAYGSPACFGVQSAQLRFYSAWWLRVLGAPLLLMSVVNLYCTVVPLPRPTSATWRSAGSLVLFLSYPGVCNAAFSLFSCRAIGPLLSDNVLVVDAKIACSGAVYRAHFVLAMVVTAGAALVPTAPPHD